MLSQKLTAFGLLVCLLLSTLTQSGCGPSGAGDAAIRNANQNNIQRLTNLYSRHQLSNGGKGPASEAEFRKFIQGLDAQTLGNIGVDSGNLDKLFLSERDNKAFSIRYGVAGNTRGSNDAIVFEVEGKEGKRQVGFTSLAIRDVENSDYEALKAGQPASSTATPSALPPGAGR
ncbi:MAG: hypothetical protein ACK493_09735 [Planctomycetota bacterium]|jgi:hypothetical protein